MHVQRKKLFRAGAGVRRRINGFEVSRPPSRARPRKKRSVILSTAARRGPRGTSFAKRSVECRYGECLLGHEWLQRRTAASIATDIRRYRSQIAFNAPQRGARFLLDQFCQNRCGIRVEIDGSHRHLQGIHCGLSATLVSADQPVSGRSSWKPRLFYALIRTDHQR